MNGMNQSFTRLFDARAKCYTSNARRDSFKRFDEWSEVYFRWRMLIPDDKDCFSLRHR
jgi:hypothetical protein